MSQSVGTMTVNAEKVLDEFNNLVDLLETAEADLESAAETVKLKKADVNTIVLALRAKAREMRHGHELPLFPDESLED